MKLAKFPEKTWKHESYGGWTERKNVFTWLVLRISFRNFLQLQKNMRSIHTQLQLFYYIRGRFFFSIINKKFASVLMVNQNLIMQLWFNERKASFLVSLSFFYWSTPPRHNVERRGYHLNLNCHAFDRAPFRLHHSPVTTVLSRNIRNVSKSMMNNQ